MKYKLSVPNVWPTSSTNCPGRDSCNTVTNFTWFPPPGNTWRKLGVRHHVFLQTLVLYLQCCLLLFFLVHLVCSYSVWPCYMGARSRCWQVMSYAIQQINPQPPSVLLTSSADASKMKLLAFSLQEQQAATVTGVHRQFVYLVLVTTSSAVVYNFQSGVLFSIENATFLANFGYFFFCEFRHFLVYFFSS